ncbi:MAG TPA: DUF2608 domain-containing protein [Xanthomonadales bacterium]|nr:DUF2608 domain-containing protein [Xanthomonadales bacterium]
MSRYHVNALLLVLCLGLVGLLSACAGTPAQSASPSSRMIETTDLAQVADTALKLAGQVGADHVLVVFDLDNTLLAMEQGLGSDQWYDWQKAISTADPCDPIVVVDRLAVQGALYFASAMRLTQADAPAQVRKLQEHGLKVIILTSRGDDFRLQTFRELRRGGFSFYASAFGPPGGYAETFMTTPDSRPVRYEDGVFLTAGQHKGEMLQALLNKTLTPWPAVIVMADDKAGNLQAVLGAFAGSATSVQAFRYGGEDATVAAFDHAEAVRQWNLVEPDLRGLQAQFGADNYDLPAASAKTACSAVSPRTVAQ